MNILVLTLYSGEHEFAANQSSLTLQTHQEWDQEVIEGLPNRQAHHQLYQTIMDKAGEYDLFLKLDADMILAHGRALEEMAAYFRHHPNLDHAVYTVWDTLSDAPVIGAHVFSKRVRWELSDDVLFVDPDPTREGERQLVRPAKPVILHMPDPSDYQAFHYGVHRAMKIMQWNDNGRPRIRSAWTHWKLLQRVAARYKDNPEQKRLLALLGAEAVIKGDITSMGEVYEEPKLRSYMQEHRTQTSQFSPLRKLVWARLAKLFLKSTFAS